jgi:nicotinate-nucleotide adenylyltransferase
LSGGVGIFGGTFNPIHLGHLRAAEEVREALGLAEVRFVPCAVPPHKTDATLPPPTERLRMVELAVAGVPGFRAWDVEVLRPGPSYSIDTVRALRTEVGERTPIAFVLGRDAFADFANWREPDAILGLCDVVVITRPPWPATLDVADFPVASQGAVWYDPRSGVFRHASGHTVRLLPITALDVSATAIRERLRAGRSIRFLVPAAVEAYIAAAGLYRAEVTAR